MEVGGYGESEVSKTEPETRERKKGGRRTEYALNTRRARRIWTSGEEVHGHACQHESYDPCAVQFVI